MKKSILSLLLIVFFFITACQDDDLDEGINSLEGSWQVTAVESFYDITHADGSLDRSKVSEDGNLGRFEFTEDTVRFQFNRNDTLYQGAERWHLSRTRENQGFFKVNRFTLEIGNTFLFDCEYGDQTKHSEKNANGITLRTEPEETSNAVGFELSLNKE